MFYKYFYKLFQRLHWVPPWEPTFKPWDIGSWTTVAPNTWSASIFEREMVWRQWGQNRHSSKFYFGQRIRFHV